jgi:hypothetical protein
MNDPSKSTGPARRRPPRKRPGSPKPQRAGAAPAARQPVGARQKQASASQPVRTIGYDLCARDPARVLRRAAYLLPPIVYYDVCGSGPGLTT